MAQTPDAVTVALTGHLPFNLLLAAILTWPIALGLLRLYTRAVRRSMRSHAPGTPAPSIDAPDPSAVDQIPGRTVTSAAFEDLAAATVNPAADGLAARLMTRPWQAASVYAIGGCAYGLVMAASQLLADAMEIRTLRFLFLFWIYGWPIVLTVGIVSASTRSVRTVVTVGYFIGLSVLGGIGIAFSADLTWGQIFLAWIMFDLPPTILLLTYLSRGVRAVGPLILTFMVLALTGSDLAVSLAGSRDSFIRMILNVTNVIGVGGTGTFVLLLGAGFVVFAAAGWMILLWIRRRYQAKQLSDESVTIDAIWILFAIVHSMNLVFGHPLWAVASLVAVGAYKLCVRLGFWWLGHRQGASTPGPVLLVLRSFSIGRDSERLFDVIDRAWRRVGSLQMIAGIDLARRTVEPHEFLDFLAGKLARRFIDGPGAMDQRMRERDTRPDRDLRFRVNDFFCYDDTWKMVLSRLVHESDAVLMDLRGFSRQNTGCVFELHELVRLVPLDRVVFVVDQRTDEALLAQTLGNGRAGVYRLRGISDAHIRALMRALAAAATSTAALVA